MEGKAKKEKKTKTAPKKVHPVEEGPKKAEASIDDYPAAPPNIDLFGVSPQLDPALTPRQSDAINKRAVLSEWDYCD